MIPARAAGAVLLVSLLVASACAMETAEPGYEAFEAPPIESEREPAPGIREPGALTTVTGVAVLDRTGPGGEPFEVARRTPDAPAHLARRIGRETFDLGLRVRKPDLTQYPCSSCHMGRDLALGVDRIADAHQDIRAGHPSETIALCGTCHAPADVELLRLLSGETITIDHTYRLCAQCHFEQLDAWAAGAHGKRLDGWQGRRVVMGCADCHDPHDPSVEPRIPYPGPRILRPGLRER
jgi:hypothetical protein